MGAPSAPAGRATPLQESPHGQANEGEARSSAGLDRGAELLRERRQEDSVELVHGRASLTKVNSELASNARVGHEKDHRSLVGPGLPEYGLSEQRVGIVGPASGSFFARLVFTGPACSLPALQGPAMACS
jgi:hypothetical protein